MVNISIDVTDLGGEARPGDKVTLWSPRVAGSATHAGRVISTAPVDVFLTNGKATVPDVEPGSMRVLLQCRGVESQGPIPVTVPDGDHTVTLRSLIESQFEYSPPIVSAVQEAADNAAASERAAIQAQVRSEAAADRAETRVDEAINNGANLIRAEVKQDADRAVSARQAAKTSETNAKSSETVAATSEANAVAFQAAAASAAFSAKTSETNAKASETNAASSAASAKSQQESALTHLNNTVAEAGKAAGSAAAAKDSETKAAASASASASSASSSKTQADKSATSATQSAASRDAAKASETAAAGSASAAKASETNAAQSSASANAHRSEAANRAATAAQDATRAEAARDAAQQSQAAAKTSETNAAAHETNSGASAEAAATSATEAKGHADRAEQMADPTGLRDEIMQQLADLVDGAPEDLDTIREVAEYAQENRDITDQLNAAIGNKADKGHTHAWASITGRPDIPVTDVGYRIRWADHAPNLYPAGVSVSMSATEQGWGTALAAGNPDYVDDGFVVILTIRNGTYAQSAIQMVFSYTNVTRPVYIRKYNGEASGWSNFRRLTNDGHKHSIADINGAASKDYVDSRPALFSGSGAPPSSIPGATVGDWWLDTSTMELHKITGV